MNQSEQLPRNPTETSTPRGKTRRRREFRKRTHEIRTEGSGNKWKQIRLSLDRARNAFAKAVEQSNNDWDNLVWPPGWDAEKYRTISRYCLDLLEKHRDGRLAAIWGDQHSYQNFNSWLFEAVETLQTAREQGIIE